MKQILLIVSLLSFSLIASAQEIKTNNIFPKDSLYGSWVFYDMWYLKHNNSKRIKYYDNPSIFHFKQDSFLRTYHILQDTNRIRQGTFTFSNDTLFLNRIERNGEIGIYEFKIEKIGTDTIDLLGKYDHSSHGRLVKLDKENKTDTNVIKRILNSGLCKITYPDYIPSSNRHLKKTERFKKIYLTDNSMLSYTINHTRNNRKRIQSKYKVNKIKITHDKPSGNSFILFSGPQKTLQIKTIVNDTIIGNEREKDFKEIKIHPIGPVNMPKIHTGKWIVHKSNGADSIIDIKIKESSITIFNKGGKRLKSLLDGNGTGNLFTLKTPFKINGLTYKHLLLSESSKIENKKRQTVFTTIYLSEKIDSNNGHYFKLKKEFRKIITDSIFFEAFDKKSQRFLTITRYNNYFWANISPPNRKDLIEKECYLANLTVLATSSHDIQKAQKLNIQPPLSKSSSTNYTHIENLSKKDISYEWVGDTDVILKIKNEPFLFFTENEYRGFSKSLKYSYSYGNTWNEKEFSKIKQ